MHAVPRQQWYMHIAQERTEQDKTSTYIHAYMQMLKVHFYVKPYDTLQQVPTSGLKNQDGG